MLDDFFYVNMYYTFKYNKYPNNQLYKHLEINFLIKNSIKK